MEKKEVNKLLANDHSELDEKLNKLFAAFETGDVEQIYQNLDIFWARLAMHIRAEHLHLFPAILHAAEKLPSSTRAQNVIEQLQNDHNFFMRELTGAIKQMRLLQENNSQEKPNLLLTIGTVYEKIVSVSNRLKTHNEIEETGIYQWADALLNPPERAALNERMRRELENLPPRFVKSEEIF